MVFFFLSSIIMTRVRFDLGDNFHSVEGRGESHAEMMQVDELAY